MSGFIRCLRMRLLGQHAPAVSRVALCYIDSVIPMRPRIWDHERVTDAEGAMRERRSSLRMTDTSMADVVHETSQSVETCTTQECQFGRQA